MDKGLDNGGQLVSREIGELRDGGMNGRGAGQRRQRLGRLVEVDEIRHRALLATGGLGRLSHVVLPPTPVAPATLTVDVIRVTRSTRERRIQRRACGARGSLRLRLLLSAALLVAVAGAVNGTNCRLHDTALLRAARSHRLELVGGHVVLHAFVANLITQGLHNTVRVPLVEQASEADHLLIISGFRASSGRRGMLHLTLEVRLQVRDHGDVIGERTRTRPERIELVEVRSDGRDAGTGELELVQLLDCDVVLLVAVTEVHFQLANEFEPITKRRRGAVLEQFSIREASADMAGQLLPNGGVEDPIATALERRVDGRQKTSAVAAVVKQVRHLADKGADQVELPLMIVSCTGAGEDVRNDDIVGIITEGSGPFVLLKHALVRRELPQQIPSCSVSGEVGGGTNFDRRRRTTTSKWHIVFTGCQIRLVARVRHRQQG